MPSRGPLPRTGRRQEGSGGPGLWELGVGGELLMPGWVGALSCLRLAGFPTDLGASDICKIFCADFHACVMTQEPFS